MEEYYSIPHYQYSGRRKPCMNTGVNTSVTIDCTTVETEIEPDNEPHNCSISIDTNDLIDHLDCKVFSKVQLMSPYTLNGCISDFKTKSIISQPSELRLKKRKVKKLRFLMVPEHKAVNELTINLNGIADAGDDEEFYMIRDMNTDTDDFIFYLSKNFFKVFYTRFDGILYLLYPVSFCVFRSQVINYKVRGINYIQGFGYGKIILHGGFKILVKLHFEN
jgi:hypothetical protein